MSRPFIVLGDKTSHGGTVISADMSFSIHGKYVARVGDLTVCPKCKGTFPIQSGTSDMSSMGQAPAVDGDKTTCGAVLISGQVTTTWSALSTSGDPAADQKTEALLAGVGTAAVADSGICLDCLMKAAAAGTSVVVRD